ncbi:MAG: DUF389 domain-containing protein [Chloroflexota bacterium]|nr:DUF389 domain-containing protein [Chloroflexota bacterium]
MSTRVVEITVPSKQTDDLIAEIRDVQGLIGLRAQRNVSIQPPGDVITVEMTNTGFHKLMRYLAHHNFASDSGVSMTTTVPLSVISHSSTKGILLGGSDITWEEMAQLIGRESNMTVNALILMACAGIFAAVGLATNALHLVIAAMAIAPGFLPILRVALGVVAESQTWRHGVLHVAQGYIAMTASAAATALVLRALGTPPLGGEATYLPEGVLINYWTTITIPSLLVSAAASVAGAVLMATNRSVLTTAVMIALALVPAASIVGMALVTGEVGLAGSALLRWIIEVGLVAGASLLVFAWKRSTVQQRKMLL